MVVHINKYIMDNNLINKIKQVLTDPINFFESLRKETGIKSAFVYLLILSLFSTFLGFIVGQLFQNNYYDLLSKMFGFEFPKPQFAAGMLILFTAMGYCIGLIYSFIMAGILHVWILIFGGKENYSKTYQLYVYSRTPQFIIGWIPFIGYLTWIYDLVLLIIGTQKVHNISKVKAVLMYAIPIVLIGLFSLGIMIFSISLLKSNPNIFQN